MKSLCLCVALSLMLTAGAWAVEDFDIGENRLLNSDFESDTAGDLAAAWSLEKGG